MISAWVSPDILRNAIAPVTALVDEAQIRFEKGGMRIQTVDSARVGAVYLDLLNDAFHSYEADGQLISLDLSRVEEYISSPSGQGQYFIEQDSDSGRLQLSTGKYEFEVSLVDPDTVRTGPDPREIETPAAVTIDSNEFSEAIRTASMFSDNIKMGVDSSKDEFYMKAKGEIDRMNIRMHTDDVENLEIANAYGSYSLPYLSDIRKAIPPGISVELGLGEELPLRIQYEIANGNGRISYGLAPRT